MKRLDIFLNDLFKEKREELDRQLFEIQAQILSVESDLENLRRTNIGQADYVVRIKPHCEGICGKPVQVTYEGRLKDAIAIAEEIFYEQNKDNPARAEYSAYILLGTKEHEIPFEYIEEFRRKQFTLETTINQE